MTSETHARRQGEQLLALQHHVTHMLLTSQASHDLVDLLLNHVATVLGAHSASFSLIDKHAGTLQRGGVQGYDPDAITKWAGIPLQPGAPITDSVLSRTPVYLTASEWDERYPHLASIRLPSMHFTAAIPLVVDDEALGVITLSWDDPASITDPVRTTLEHFAGQCALTLERIALQQQLTRQTRRLTKLLEYSSDLLLVLDAHTNVTYLSPSAQQLLGYSQAEFATLRLRDIVHSDELPEFQDQFGRAVATPHQALRMNLRVRHADGQWMWFDVIGRNLLADPDVRGVVCNARDMTETMQALRDLRDSEQQQRAHAERYERLLTLITSIDSHVEPDALIAAVLEQGLAVTKYDQAFYHTIQHGVSTLRFARGQRIEAALSMLPATRDLRELGRSGAAMLDHQLFFAKASEPIFDPPERMPRTQWRAFCALPIVIDRELRGSIAFASSTHDEVSEEHRQLMRGLSDHINVLLERRWHLHQLDVSRDETLRAIGLAMEYRDHETKGHTDRVVAMTERLGRLLDLSGPDLDSLRWGAYLHDVGKIGTPDAILLKPGKLDPDEWEVMKRHAHIGYEMLAQIPSLPSSTLDVVLHHHERWNGSGYPSGLRGRDTPLAARIFAVVDVYDALTSERPYKRAWTHEQALEQLEREAGSLLDPEMVELFVRHADQITAAPARGPVNR